MFQTQRVSFRKGASLCLGGFALFLVLGQSSPAFAMTNVAANVQVSPTTNILGFTESTIVADPTNMENLFAGSNLGASDCTSGTYNPVQGFKSSNGGATWSSSSRLPTTNGDGVDPAPTYDASGTLFYSYLDEICSGTTHTGSQLVIVKSTDKGATWTNPAGGGGFNIIDTNTIDKPALAADTSSSLYQNRLYAAYVSIFTKPWKLYFVDSTDHGATWNPPSPRTPIDSDDDTGSAVDVGPNGNVYVSWWDMTQQQIRLLTSTNGGASFNLVTSASPNTSIPAPQGYTLPNYGQGSANNIFADTSIAVDRSGGASNGNVYVVYTDRLVPPATGPTLTASTGGSLPAGSGYQVGYSFVTGRGETAASPLVGVVLNAGQNAVQTADLSNLPPNVTAVNYYLTAVPFGSGVATGFVGSSAVIAGTAAGILIAAGGNNTPPPNGQLHVFLSRSTNGGSTFAGDAVRLDTGNPNDAWEPTVSVDQSNGNVSVAWYDRRDDMATPNKLYHVYYTRSTDGGVTFLPSQVRVSNSVLGDPTTDPKGTGDYMGIASGCGVAHPTWVQDTSTNVMGVWTAGVTDREVGTAWTKNVGNGPSPARQLSASAFDGGHNQLVLFGGTTTVSGGPAGALNDTWTWDGCSWTKQPLQTNPAPPSPRLGAGMAYDPAIGRVVLFGGQGPTTPNGMNDTWTWDGSVWTPLNLDPTKSPPIAGSASLAYDAATGTVVLFEVPSGQKGTPLAQTWSFNGSTWTKQAVTNPPFRSWPGFSYDSVHSQVVLFGGEQITKSSTTYMNDTWLWNGSTWVVSGNPPPAALTGRALMGMGFDAALGVTVMTMGFSGSSLLSDTWTWNGSNWAKASAGTVSPVREAFAMTYFGLAGTMVLTGGSDSVPEVLADSWLY